jgi:hypothetical protein
MKTKYKSDYIVVQGTDGYYRIKILKRFLWFSWYEYYTERKHHSDFFETIKTYSSETWAIEQIECLIREKLRKRNLPRKPRIVYRKDEH